VTTFWRKNVRAIRQLFRRRAQTEDIGVKISPQSYAGALTMDSSLRFDQTSDSEKSLVPEILDLVKDLSREAEHLRMQVLGASDAYTGAGGDFESIGARTAEMVRKVITIWERLHCRTISGIGKGSGDCWRSVARTIRSGRFKGRIFQRTSVNKQLDRQAHPMGYQKMKLKRHPEFESPVAPKSGQERLRCSSCCSTGTRSSMPRNFRNDLLLA
jgi:hypothetical protein